MNTLGKMLGLIVLLPLGLWPQNITVVESSDVSVSVLVVDENDQVVSNADVQIYFEGSENVTKNGRTGKDGAFTAVGKTTGVVFYAARKTGYYDSLGLRIDYMRERATMPWEPRATIKKLVLKRIIDPVPMYARKMILTVPELNIPLSFDLEAGDWVAPYGKGVREDFVFTVTRRWKDFDDFDAVVRLSFSNRLDGIAPFEAELMRGSQLSSPHRAPEGGYLSEWIRGMSNNFKEGRRGINTDNGHSFVFRVRSREDAVGTLKEANVGKIYGDISLAGFANPQPELGFTYYYNPEVNSRSLEFDLNKNLFHDTKIKKP